MVGSVILPSLTNMMVLSVFQYLVNTELQKAFSNNLDFRYGCQEGMITCLSIMFGNAEEAIAQEAYDTEQTWLQLTERIVNEKLKNWAYTIGLKNDNHDLEIDYKQMNKDVKEAVNNFALEHPDLLMNSLNRNL